MYLNEAADVEAAVPECPECFQDSRGPLILGKKEESQMEEKPAGQTKLPPL